MKLLIVLTLVIMLLAFGCAGKGETKPADQVQELKLNESDLSLGAEPTYIVSEELDDSGITAPE